MDNQQTLFKGELMEELLRNYFLSLGYYVVRGIKLKYENNDLTDVDLFLYGRSSSLTRQRINVDIKNKKTPQAFERIVWANGLMKILNFDSCIVATTDSRPVVQSFAHTHKTTILDGSFLQKLRSNPSSERISEEDLLNELSKHKSYKSFGNKDWRLIYELSKSKLLTEQDFSGFNSSLINFQYFIDKALTDEQKREAAIRMSYIVLSHILIIIDFILKDIAFLEPQDREKKLSDGFKFGNLGKDGVDKIISMAVEISGSKSASGIMKSLENIPTNILKDFFVKNENAKNIFNWAKDFENLGFKKVLTYPDKLDAPLKAIISVMLDFFSIERKKYFETLQTKL
jgi:hypothetical protein